MTENKNSKNKSLSKQYTISTQLKLNSVAEINLQYPNSTILTDINSELKDIPVDLDLIKTITEFKIRNNEFVNGNGWNRKYYTEFNDRAKESFRHETEFNDSMYELIENKLDALYSDNNIRKNLFNVVHGLKWITNLANSVVLD